MKKLYVPLLVSEDSCVSKEDGLIFFSSDGFRTFYSAEDAKEFARRLVITNPKSKAIVAVSELVIEPRRMEFSEKKYNENGELIV